MIPPLCPSSCAKGPSLPQGERRCQDLLVDTLKNSEILNQASRIFIGFSGGVDSSVLLHALAQDQNFLKKIQAVHVNHQLQDAAGDFEKFCVSFCEDLKIDLKILRPSRPINSGESLEAYAREIRYECFRSCLENSQDILVTAQHLEDQAETFLIQLFRGAGLAGLASMPVLSNLGSGVLYRPFLNISKNNIKNYADFFKLNFINDPSNLDVDLDRNFLRQEIFPRLKQRYLGLEKNIARSARHCASAQELLDQQALGLLKNIGGELGKKLNLKYFWDLKKLEQVLVLRFWLASFDLILSEAQTEILLSNKKIKIKIKNKNKFVEIREFKNFFYVVLDDQFFSGSAHRHDFVSPLVGEADQRALGLLGREGASLEWPWEINLNHILKSLEIQGIDLKKLDLNNLNLKIRTEEEKIKYPGAAHHKSFKNIFQERQVPPWLRKKIPLIYEGENLIGIVLPEVFE